MRYLLAMAMGIAVLSTTVTTAGAFSGHAGHGVQGVGGRHAHKTSCKHKECVNTHSGPHAGATATASTGK